MVIIALLAFLAVLVAARVFALIGRDGEVHPDVPGVKRASAYRKRLERKLGVHH